MDAYEYNEDVERWIERGDLLVEEVKYLRAALDEAEDWIDNPHYRRLET